MSRTWQRVGLIVNPFAGRRTPESLIAARNAVEKLHSEKVFTADGELGAAAFSGWFGQLQVHSAAGHTGREQTRAIAEWIISLNVDAMIVIGGDGTLSDVAQVCIDRASRIPILGLGGGSTNVGRLITCRTDRVQELKSDELETWSADCLIASVNDRILGLGFNDVVIGYTVVGTIETERKDVDAAEYLKERIVAGRPRTIGNYRTRVLRTTTGIDTLIADGEKICTVIAGFAEPAFFGKAVTGGVCLTALAALPAGCLVSNTPLVRVGITPQEVLQAPPVISQYVSLSEETTIVVENINDGAALCADGNVLYLLTASDRVQISVRSGAVVGIRASKDLRSS